jgi:hypothetical protein
MEAVSQTQVTEEKIQRHTPEVQAALDKRERGECLTNLEKAALMFDDQLLKQNSQKNAKEYEKAYEKLEQDLEKEEDNCIEKPNFFRKWMINPLPDREMMKGIFKVAAAVTAANISCYYLHNILKKCP